MWSSGGFAFAWLPAGTVPKGRVPDPKGGTGASSKVRSLATASSKLLRGTPAARLLPAWQPAPEQEGDTRAKPRRDPLSLSPRSCPTLCLLFTKKKV